jgi:hypothetical protein
VAISRPEPTTWSSALRQPGDGGFARSLTTGAVAVIVARSVVVSRRVIVSFRSAAVCPAGLWRRPGQYP